MILILQILSHSKGDYCIIEQKNKISINVFCNEKDNNSDNYHVHVSDKQSDKSMDILLIADENKSQYVYIKDFNRFMIYFT